MIAFTVKAAIGALLAFFVVVVVSYYLFALFGPLIGLWLLRRGAGRRR